MSTRPEPIFMPFETANLCLDCNQVGNYADHCAHCQSKSLICLSTCIAERALPRVAKERINHLIEQLDSLLQ